MSTLLAMYLIYAKALSGVSFSNAERDVKLIMTSCILSVTSLLRWQVLTDAL